MAYYKRRNKYGARKTTVNDITFDSKKEALRYLHLMALLKEGKITCLRLQPRFLCAVNGKKICDYYADFMYMDENGVEIIEDVKSPATAKNTTYRLKKKVVEALHDVFITEVL